MSKMGSYSIVKGQWKYFIFGLSIPTVHTLDMATGSFIKYAPNHMSSFSIPLLQWSIIMDVWYGMWLCTVHQSCCRNFCLRTHGSIRSCTRWFTHRNFRCWAEPWKALPRTYQYSFCCHRLKIRHVLAVCPWANQMQKTEFARFLCAFNLKHEPLLKPVRSEIRNSRISVSVRINYLDKTLESNNFGTFNHHFGTVPNHSNQRARNNFHGSVKTITLRFVSIILSQYW